MDTDSVSESAHQLEHVVVTSERLSRKVAVSMPVQMMDGKEMEKLGIQNLADAVRRLAGATVKDYGGVGGLKTVSIRGLGTEHTAVAYDGVVLSNCQAGQIDIGRFNLDDIAMLSLSVGQQNDLLQAARMYASAGVLSVSTQNPLDGKEDPYMLVARLKGGSFGWVNPSFKWAQRIGQRTSYNVIGNFQRTDGMYPFTLVNGRLTTHEKRRNTDVMSWCTEGNLYHTFKDHSKLDTKIYFFDSERGLPGAVIYYNNQASERMWEKNAFVQTRYVKTFSENWRLQAEAKYNYSWDKYEDTDVKYLDGKQIDINKQQEYYLSGTCLWMPSGSLFFSWANDAVLNLLDSNAPIVSEPVRWTWLSALHASWQWRFLTLNGTLVGTFVKETVKSGDCPDDRKRLSPTVSVLIQPWQSQRLFLRLMYKDTFRVPTFNDLYYHNIGNTGLRPEKAHEYNVGVTWEAGSWKILENLFFTADAYYNHVDDKIVAMPSTYVWKMLNYGKVDITGMDVSLRSFFKVAEKISVQMSATYAYQKAIDLTNAESKNYKHQIPYTPCHSGNTSLLFQTPWLDLGYSIVFAGERYSMKQNLPEYLLERYHEHTLSVSRDFHLKKGHLSLRAEIINLTNAQYDVIQFYPMPGRSFRGSVQMDF